MLCPKYFADTVQNFDSFIKLQFRFEQKFYFEIQIPNFDKLGFLILLRQEIFAYWYIYRTLQCMVTGTKSEKYNERLKWAHTEGRI